MKKKSTKKQNSPKPAMQTLDHYSRILKKPPLILNSQKSPPKEVINAPIRGNTRLHSANKSSDRGSSQQRSSNRPRFKKLLRKQSSEQEYLISKGSNEKDSDEEMSDVEVAGPSRFAMGDIDELRKEEEAKKIKNKKIDEMIKKEKSQPKKEKKPSEKFSQEKKAKLKQLADKLPKLKKIEKPNQDIDNGQQLDSDEERQIRINRVKAQEQRQIARAIEQSELQEALRRSKLDESATKTAVGQGSSKKTEMTKAQEEEDEEIIEIYMRNKKGTENKLDKPKMPFKTAKAEEEKPKAGKSKPKKEAAPKNSKDTQPNVIYGPLSGKIFVLTGQFPEGRSKMEDMLRGLGAAIRGSVSRKTDYLCQGTHLEDGRDPDTSGKSKKAIEFNVKIVKYEDLDALMVRLTDKTIGQHLNYKPPATVASLTKPKPLKMECEPNILARTDLNLWTEKYKPQSLEEIIGQNSQIQNLRQWLSSWQDVHVRGIKHEVKHVYNPSPFAGGNINCKAALVSGEPGIGKTTAAKMVCQQLGYDFVEYNASDTRNKNSVLQIEFNSMTLDMLGKSHKRVIIMDEVDGMSAGDRGGISAIIQRIKSSKTPIICICNDRQHDKIKTLAGHCYDIKFFKPNKTLVVKRLIEILAMEGISAEEQSLLHIVEVFNNDFRQILNYLDMASRTQQRFTYLETKDNIKKNTKDTLNSLNKWQASIKLLNRAEFSRMTIRNRLDIFFTDTDMIPLMIEDSLVPSMVKKSKYTSEDMRNLTKAYDSICQSDVLGRAIRMEQQWSLMPLQGFLSCIYPPEMVSNSVGFTKFPEWLGKNSTTKKNTREIRELKNAMSLVISGNNRAVTQDYCPAILSMFIKAMDEQDTDSILDFMEEYRLTPEMIKDHLLDVQYNPKKLDMMASISSQTKAKLTKEYNKRHETSLKMKKSKQIGGSGDGAARYNDLLEEVIIESQEQMAEGDGEDSTQNDNVEIISKDAKKSKSKPKKK